MAGAGSEYSTTSPEEYLQRVTSPDFMRRAMMDQGLPVLACDLDEVLVPIMPKWVGLLADRGLCDPALADPAACVARTSYRVDDYTGASNVDVMDVYGEDFYDDLEPTTLGAALAALIEVGAVRACIISHTVPRTEASKRAFCARHWPGVEVVAIPGHMPKGPVVARHCPDWSTFVDDVPENLLSAAATSLAVGRELLMPSFGYNRELPHGLEYIASRGFVSVQRYEPAY